MCVAIHNHVASYRPVVRLRLNSHCIRKQSMSVTICNREREPSTSSFEMYNNLQPEVSDISLYSISGKIRSWLGTIRMEDYEKYEQEEGISDIVEGVSFDAGMKNLLKGLYEEVRYLVKLNNDMRRELVSVSERVAGAEIQLAKINVNMESGMSASASVKATSSRSQGVTPSNKYSNYTIIIGSVIEVIVTRHASLYPSYAPMKLSRLERYISKLLGADVGAYKPILPECKSAKALELHEALGRPARTSEASPLSERELIVALTGLDPVHTRVIKTIVERLKIVRKFLPEETNHCIHSLRLPLVVSDRINYNKACMHGGAQTSLEERLCGLAEDMKLKYMIGLLGCAGIDCDPDDEDVEALIKCV